MFTVIPAQAGIQLWLIEEKHLDSRLRGNDGGDEREWLGDQRE